MHASRLKASGTIIVMRTCLMICLTFTVTSLKAQIGRGCYVGDVLYTTNTSAGNRYFYRDEGALTNPCGYLRTGNTNDCRLYNGGNINKNKSYTLYPGAFSNHWEEIPCPIDDEVWILLILVAGFAVFKFKSLNNKLSIF